MQMTLTFDPLNEKEMGEAHAILTILGADQGTTGTLAVTTSTPAAEEKAAADKKPTAAEKKAEADAKKKADEEKAQKEADEKAAAEAAAAPKFTRDEVRQKLKEYAALAGKPAAIKLLKDNGADSIGELDEAAFEKVMEACDA